VVRSNASFFSYSLCKDIDSIAKSLSGFVNASIDLSAIKLKSFTTV